MADTTAEVEEQGMEPLEGIEPPAYGLRNRRSTAEPQWQ